METTMLSSSLLLTVWTRTISQQLATCSFYSGPYISSSLFYKDKGSGYAQFQVKIKQRTGKDWRIIFPPPWNSCFSSFIHVGSIGWVAPMWKSRHRALQIQRWVRHFLYSQGAHKLIKANKKAIPIECATAIMEINTYLLWLHVESCFLKPGISE